MSTIYEMTAAAIFTDEDPTKAHHLDLENVKIPALSERSKDHTPGGGVMSVKFGMRSIEPITIDFKLKGINPRTMAQFGINTPNRRRYTVRGNVIDMRTGEEIASKAIVEGRILSVDIDQFSRDSGVSTGYRLDEIVHYEFHLGNDEIYYFNFWEGPSGFRVNGVSTFLSMTRNLGLA